MRPDDVPRRTAIWFFLTLGWRVAPRQMTWALIRGLIMAVAGISYSIGFRLIVDAGLEHDGRGVLAGVLVASVLACTSWVLAVVGAQQNQVLTDRINLELGARIGRTVAHAPRLNHFENPDDLREIDQLRDNRRALASSPAQVLSGLQIGVQAVGTVALLAWIYPPVLAVPVLAVLPWLAGRRAAKLQQRADDDLAEKKRLTGDLFSVATTAASAMELRTYGMTEALTERHAALSEEVRAGSVRAAIRGGLWEAAGWLAYAGGFVGAIVVLVLQAAHGNVSPGQVVMAASLIRRAQSQVSRSTGTADSLASAMRSARRLVWAERYLAPAAAAGEPVPETLGEGIRFEGVSFTYPGGDEPVLHGVDLLLPAGATVAVIGENGAGKTTLVKLLTGMYEPTGGRITVDGVDLAAVEPGEWRRHITAIFQDFMRPQMILRDAVGMGDLPRRSDDPALRAALARAGADALKLDPSTLLGRFFAGGRDLSGGQWQRVGLARGMMRPAPLLTVLDEPTAALDAPTEAALFERFAGAAERSSAAGAVTVLVSHRFSTVRIADLIVVVEGGRITETGGHEQLLAAGGTYAQLFALQARAYLSES
ncbi:ABC transporter ATP-binding protein [Actinoplanes sp. NPDC051411]|uniref:ABC transporter ATP-binding protein n=1 Tax=Actinoplanes sp. NPDC051411 TaxID=3155522 RepID=UPI003423ACDE